VESGSHRENASKQKLGAFTIQGNAKCGEPRGKAGAAPAARACPEKSSNLQ
jgi:hypothetical protein